MKVPQFLYCTFKWYQVSFPIVDVAIYTQLDFLKNGIGIFLNLLLSGVFFHFCADALKQLDEIRSAFASVMQKQMTKTFASKLGMKTLDSALFNELIQLMMQTSVDYTIFFRELSSIPDDIEPLKKSFYRELSDDLDQRWSDWLTKWKSLVMNTSEQMKNVNPKYSLREWLLAPAYQQAGERSHESFLRQ